MSFLPLMLTVVQFCFNTMAYIGIWTGSVGCRLSKVWISWLSEVFLVQFDLCQWGSDIVLETMIVSDDDNMMFFNVLPVLLK